MSNRKLIVYISMSLDGFLATRDDDLSWLSIAEKEGVDYGYASFTESVDTYIVGRKTYDVVRNLLDGAFPQGKQYDCYVITRREKSPENGVTFYTGNLEELIRDIKSKPGKNIYCDGGGVLVKLLMEHDLIDEYIISVMPIILGDGKRLFQGGTPQLNIKLQSSEQYETGVVQLRYARQLPTTD